MALQSSQKIGAAVHPSPIGSRLSPQRLAWAEVGGWLVCVNTLLLIGRWSGWRVAFCRWSPGITRLVTVGSGLGVGGIVIYGL